MCIRDSGVAQWRKAGRYGRTPSVGSFIYFYSPSLGRVSHVGIVTSAVQSNRLYRITTIEGNSGAGENATAWRDGGKTIEHSYEVLPEQIGGKNRINGFGYPRFGEDTCTAEQLVLQANELAHFHCCHSGYCLIVSDPIGVVARQADAGCDGGEGGDECHDGRGDHDPDERADESGHEEDVDESVHGIVVI